MTLYHQRVILGFPAGAATEGSRAVEGGSSEEHHVTICRLERGYIQASTQWDYRRGPVGFHIHLTIRTQLTATKAAT